MERASGQHPVAIQFRQEVGFVCPVDGCDCAILTYHHFDPPWSPIPHNNPNGMIAICPTHHAKAEGGAWTKAELHEMKQTAAERKKRIADQFRIADEGRAAIFRIGSSYSLSSPQILNIADVPVLLERRSASGQQLFSLNLLDVHNQSKLQIVDNSLSVDATAFWDVYWSTHQNRLIVRDKKGSVALELHVSRQSLNEFLERYAATGQSDLPHLPEWLSPEERAALLRPRGLAPDLQEQLRQRCVNSDGNVAVVDIVRAKLFGNGRLLAVRNSKSLAGAFHRCFSFDNPIAFGVAGSSRLEKLYRERKNKITLDDALIIHREKLLLELMPDSPESCMCAAQIYADAVRRFPATMATAAGMRAFRIGQTNPNFLA